MNCFTLSHCLWFNLCRCLRRPGLSARFCLRLHRRHLCGGLPAGVRLLLLPSLPDVSGTDHQRVVLDPPTLQPRCPRKPASHPGPSLVPLLALSAHPITSAWRWDQLPGHRIAGTYPITDESLNVTRLRVFAFVVMINGNGSSNKDDHLGSRIEFDFFFFFYAI